MKTILIVLQFIVMLLASALALSSCAELRKGWVKVDFLEGRPSDMVVCQIKIVKDDMVGECVSLETIERQMRLGAPHVDRMPDGRDEL